jgi:hypothetical protein
MASHQNLTTEQALELHKKYLQDILQNIMLVFETGDASIERMIRGLNGYWDANYQHRVTRRTVYDTLKGTPYENSTDSMGRPFELMLRAELHASNVQNDEVLSKKIYEEAREIALAETISGKRNLKRRKQLVSDIKKQTLSAAAL